ncbi:zeta toxin family protein [Geobacillus sp. BK01]|uniref:zeta toxin family protein n=1 Tax=Geobacillus sp. BK01 TaxID=3457328 RepID=UPI003FA565DD
MKIIKTLCSVTQTFVQKRQRNRPEAKSTKEMYSIKDGKYHPQRHALHMSIVNTIVNQASSPQKGKKPIAILIGGGTASGKTTVRKAIIEKKLARMFG